MTVPFMFGISTHKLIEIANRVPLFDALTTHEKQQVVSIPNIVKVINAEQRFITQGEYDDSFYIVLSGKASVYQNGQAIAHIEGGQFVGEVGFICSQTRTADVVADTDLITFCFDQHIFLLLPVLLREKIKDRLINGLVKRIEQMNSHIKHLTTQVDILLPNEHDSTVTTKNRTKDNINFNDYISEYKPENSQSLTPINKGNNSDTTVNSISANKNGSPWCSTIK